ncbi:MAG: hypothetical protein HY699_12715 [Deltaproteobacteria bacterium]|nr:hypothetical protein [Deltaproteobacteria bacterium]
MKSISYTALVGIAGIAAVAMLRPNPLSAQTASCCRNADCDDGNHCTSDYCAPAPGGGRPSCEAEVMGICKHGPRIGWECNDGNPCTAKDQCTKNLTCVGTPKNCDDHNLCTNDSCDAGSGACINAPNTVACDDGDQCTNPDACSAGQCVGQLNPAKCLDHFKCYNVDTQEGLRSTVTLVDQFETKTTHVFRPLLICNPVDKNGEGLLHPQAHLECYYIRDASGQPPFIPQQLAVSNQFGQETELATGPNVLCVPSVKRILQLP